MTGYYGSLRPMLNAPTCLYRCLDADALLLYVGISLNPSQRLTDHQHWKAWWKDVRSITLEWFPDRFDALDAEAAAIATENPRYNAQAGMRTVMLITRLTVAMQREYEAARLLHEEWIDHLVSIEEEDLAPWWEYHYRRVRRST